MTPSAPTTHEPCCQNGIAVSITRLAGRAVYLETFGCQMNELDSELVRGNLRALGYRFTEQADSADVVLYNTCSVRENVENKIWSRVGLMGMRKKKGANFILGVIGCMAERDGADMIRRFPQVDLMCGPGELDKLPMLIDNACKTEAVAVADRVALQGNNSRRSTTLSAANDNLELLDLSRAFDPDLSSGGAAAGKSAYVRITRGCNKFCTYCVVPNTRGPEIHRPPDAIVEECKRLADAGVIEITLLGQTVNHYHYVHGTAVSPAGLELPQVGGVVTKGARAKPQAAVTTSFAELLQRIHDEVPAIRRLRFVTSFPRDFGDDILQVMAACPRICRYLHVPAQSGSNRILKLMNRGYTVEQYLDFIDRALRYLPDVCLAGDMIVGFPTETEEDFEASKALLRRVPYKNNFIFKYSPRPGTVAIDRFADDVPDDIKRRRNNELLAVQNEVSAIVHRNWVGRTVEVLIEQVREKSPTRRPDATAGTQLTIDGKEGDQNRARQEAVSPGHSASAGSLTVAVPMAATGRTAGDLIVAFDLPPDHDREVNLSSLSRSSTGSQAGQIVPVRITGSGTLILQGELARGNGQSAPGNGI